MQFSLALNMERTGPDESMLAVIKHSLDMVKMAEESGFEAALAAEHHCLEFTIAPNPFVILTHWAAHASHIRLGTAVVVAPYWHPIRVASESALVDLYSEGRLELGLGRGAFQFEFDRMLGGMSQKQGSAYLREMVPVLKKLWAGDYAHDGELWQFPTATAVPKPRQNPHPPLWIAARDPDSFDFSIKQGADIFSAPLSKPFSEMENLHRKLETAIKNNPGCRRPRWSVLRRTCVYEHPDQWPAMAEIALEHSWRFESLFSTLGMVVNGFPGSPATEAGATGRLTMETVGEGFVHGTPEQVVEELKRYEALGVDIYAYNPDFGLPKGVESAIVRAFHRGSTAALRHPGWRNRHREWITTGGLRARSAKSVSSNAPRSALRHWQASL